MPIGSHMKTSAALVSDILHKDPTDIHISVYKYSYIDTPARFVARKD